MSRWQSYAVVSLVAAVVMLTNLGGPRLWDRDEPRNAGCAVEMLVRGDWIVPVFNAELRTHKPVLLYWLMMAAYSVLGVNEFSARLPSALLAIGTALCTCEMGRHLFSLRAGTWAGIAVATSLMFIVAGRAATPDATLIFCSTLAVTLFVLGIRERRAESGKQRARKNLYSVPLPALSPALGSFLALSPPFSALCFSLSWLRAVGVFGAMGLAALAKGPVGILLPTATIVLFQLLSAPRAFEPAAHDWREWCLDVASKFTPKRVWKAAWQLRPITALAVMLVVAAPWYVWVGMRTDGEFLRGFFLEHNLGRAMGTMEGHRGNLLFYPATMLVGMFPWSVLAVPLLIDIGQRLRRGDPLQTGYLLAACWLVVYLGVFSVAKTKLPSYITPSYPAVAIVFGAFIDRWLAGRIGVSRRWLQAACAVLALVGLVIVIAIPLAVRDKLPGEGALGLIGLVPLAAGLIAWWAVRREQPRRAVGCIAGAAIAFATLLFAVGADRVDQHQLSHHLLRAIDEHSEHPRVAAYACLEPSWVFYGGRPIDEITAGQIGPTHLPFVARNDQWVPKPKVTIADVVSNGEDALIITMGRELAAIQRLLPQDFQVLETAPLFLKNDDLILLGRPNPAVIAGARRDLPR